MNYLRYILTCIAIASLLVSDVVVAVHSVSCSHGSVAVNNDAQGSENGKHCQCHNHCEQRTKAESDDSQPVGPEHDSDQCTICRGALICRFAVVCVAVLPPTFDGLANRESVTKVTLILAHEFSSALSERGPPV